MSSYYLNDCIYHILNCTVVLLVASHIGLEAVSDRNAHLGLDKLDFTADEISLLLEDRFLLFRKDVLSLRF